MKDCVLFDNFAAGAGGGLSGLGGGVFCVDCPDVAILDCTVRDNLSTG